MLSYIEYNMGEVPRHGNIPWEYPALPYLALTLALALNRWETVQRLAI